MHFIASLSITASIASACSGPSATAEPGKEPDSIAAERGPVRRPEFAVANLNKNRPDDRKTANNDSKESFQAGQERD